MIPKTDIVLIGDGAIESAVSTDTSGSATIDVDLSGNYIVDVSRIGYQGNAMILEAERLQANVGAVIRVPLRQETGTIGLTVRLYDERTNQAIARTLVHLVNTATRDTINRVTNEQGIMQLKVAGDASYELSGRVDGIAWKHPPIDATSLATTSQKPLSVSIEVPKASTSLPVISRQASARVIKDGTRRTVAPKERALSEVGVLTQERSVPPNPLEKARFTVIAGHSQKAENQQVWAETDDHLYRVAVKSNTWYLQSKSEEILLKHHPRENWWQTNGGKVVTIRNIHFAFDQHVVSPEAASELDKIVALMKRQPVLRVKASSHTDSRGHKSYNQALSKRRAQAIKHYLSRKGVSKDRIDISFYGEEKPLQFCESDECSESIHQLNRRAEFIFNFL